MGNFTWPTSWGVDVAKTTTEDCKKFLAEFFMGNPQIIRALFADARSDELWEYQRYVEDIKKWKRIYKCSPGGGTYEHPSYGMFTNGTAVSYHGEAGPRVERPITDFVSERGFRCEPFEDTVQFVVLEDKNGKLHLGDYIGD